MTFQSDIETVYVRKLTKVLIRRSQVAVAGSTTYHMQTNGSVERQNRTSLTMLRVYCSLCMTDWNRCLPEVIGLITVNSTLLRALVHTCCCQGPRYRR